MSANKLNGLTKDQAQLLLRGLKLCAAHSNLEREDKKYLMDQLKQIIEYHNMVIVTEEQNKTQY